MAFKAKQKYGKKFFVFKKTRIENNETNSAEELTYFINITDTVYMLLAKKKDYIQVVYPKRMYM